MAVAVAVAMSSSRTSFFFFSGGQQLLFSNVTSVDKIPVISEPAVDIDLWACDISATHDLQ